MPENSLLILSEYRENAFGGNIIINPLSKKLSLESGAINIELVTGTHAGLAHEGSSPIIKGYNDLFGKLKFKVLLTKDFSSPLFKQLIAKYPNGYVDFATLKETCENLALLTQADRQELANYERLIGLSLKAFNYIPKNQDVDHNFSLDERATKAPYPGYYEFVVDPKGDVYFLDWRKAKNYQMTSSAV